MITLKWAPLPEADIVSYKVYRSIIGFKCPEVSVYGKTLLLKLNGGALQTFMFGSGSIVDTINASIVGGRAYLSHPSGYFFVRSDIGKAPGSVEIVGGTSLVDLGLVAHLITEKSESELITSITAPPLTTTVIEYDDPDGTIVDFYAISTMNSHTEESAPTAWRQAIYAAGPICVIEGLIVNLQGVRMADAEVIATIQIPPETMSSAIITKEPIRTQTGSDGRFSLPVLQNAFIKLEIPAIGYTNFVTVPAALYVYIKDLPLNEDYRLQG